MQHNSLTLISQLHIDVYENVMRRRHSHFGQESP
jgi:hypothetical protein